MYDTLICLVIPEEKAPLLLPSPKSTSNMFNQYLLVTWQLPLNRPQKQLFLWKLSPPSNISPSKMCRFPIQRQPATGAVPGSQDPAEEHPALPEGPRRGGRNLWADALGRGRGIRHVAKEVPSREKMLRTTGFAVFDVFFLRCYRCARIWWIVALMANVSTCKLGCFELVSNFRLVNSVKVLTKIYGWWFQFKTKPDVLPDTVEVDDGSGVWNPHWCGLIPSLSEQELLISAYQTPRVRPQTS
jgi:hypothetical protein